MFHASLSLDCSTKQKEEWAAEDEMVRQYHQPSGHEFEQTPGDSGGQGSLVCCSPWGHKESDLTQQLTNNKCQKSPPRLTLFFWALKSLQMVIFPVVMYGCESWTIKQAEHQRIDAFELWCWRRLLRVPWTARRSNQSILKEISPEYSFEGLMLKLKLQYFGHLI